jgi:hypothetical protein
MNEFPGIKIFEGINPTLTSPYSPFSLSFYQTRKTLIDIDLYQRFLSNAIKQFRGTEVYKHYKAFLMGLGLDKSQMHSNINSEMANLEMHHNVLTIFDIAIILTEHTLNQYGYISSFDLVNMLRKEHTEHRVQLIMIDLTTHQLFHNTGEIYFHPNMCVGNWWEFLELYKDGVTPDIAKKVIKYIDRAEELEGSIDGKYSELRKNVKDWSVYNESFKHNEF